MNNLQQEVRHIAIKDLVLWTENPRDPINAKVSDQEIINRALTERSEKWQLQKLAKEMQTYYDFSELPTVVYHGKVPVVYDGNRRIALGKIKHGFVVLSEPLDFLIPYFPDEIPCNVCTKEIALQNVLRKHGDSGSWQPLERDIFLHKHMNQEKSVFLVIEEETGLISANPHLNKRFVKEEVFKDDILNKLGFSIKDGGLFSKCNPTLSYRIFTNLSEKIKNKDITTRKNRGLVLEVLDPEIRSIIDQNSDKNPKAIHLSDEIEIPYITQNIESKRQPKRIRNTQVIFGTKLYIRVGEVANLYRDICDLFEFYQNNKDNPDPSKRLSSTFPSLIRMSLRILCEAAAKDQNQEINRYLPENFQNAKSLLDQDQTTTLSSQNVNESTIIRLLHIGAHNYQAASNLDQTLALSVIIGAILTVTYGREEEK